MLQIETANVISLFIIESAYLARKKIEPADEVILSHPSVLPLAQFLWLCEFHGLLNLTDICTGTCYSMLIMQTLNEKNHDKLNHDVFDIEDELLIVVAFMLASKSPLGSLDDGYDQVSFLMAYCRSLPVKHPMSYPNDYGFIYAEHGYTPENFQEIRKLGNKRDAINYLKAQHLPESNTKRDKALVSCVLRERELLKKLNQAELHALSLLHYHLPRHYDVVREMVEFLFPESHLEITDLVTTPSNPEEDARLAEIYERIENRNAATHAPLLHALPGESNLAMPVPRRPRSLSGSSTKN
jgi:hypothetical protein